MNEVQRKLVETAFGAEIAHMEPLDGGLLGRSFRVVVGDLDAAVRLPARIGARQSVAAELDILDAAAAAGVAPRPIRLADDAAIVATEFLPRARAWTSADARRSENIDRLCACLGRLHALDITLEPLEFMDAAQRYATLASQRCALSVEELAWRDELFVLACAYDEWLVPSVPCHNDLVASNVLDDGALWLIDFEFAVQGDPILDLASVAAFNDYDVDARTRLLSRYYEPAQPRFDMAQFERAIRLVRLLAYFWALGESPPEPSLHTVRAFAAGIATVLR
jgi:thiamine kinase-like enzyme